MQWDWLQFGNYVDWTEDSKSNAKVVIEFIIIFKTKTLNPKKTWSLLALIILNLLKIFSPCNVDNFFIKMTHDDAKYQELFSINSKFRTILKQKMCHENSYMHVGFYIEKIRHKTSCFSLPHEQLSWIQIEMPCSFFYVNILWKLHVIFLPIHGFSRSRWWMNFRVNKKNSRKA